METKSFKSNPMAARLSEYTTQVPFNLPCTTIQKTLTSDDELTIEPDDSYRRHIPGNGAIYRLYGDGSHAPTFASAFKKSGLSGDYVATAGTLNLITFLFDGVDYWYSIVQSAYNPFITKNQFDALNDYFQLMLEVLASRLILQFDNISNVPVSNPNNVAEWNEFFDLPHYGNPFGVVIVDGNYVTLLGVGDFTLKDSLFGADPSGEHLISIEDSGCITVLGDGSLGALYPHVGCPILESVTLSKLRTIGSSAFRSCVSLTDIIMPDTLTDIGISAFEACESLTSVDIPSNVDSIGASAFHNCIALQAINVSENNPYYSSIDGVLFNKDITELIKFPLGKTDYYYAIPDTVTYLHEYSFSGAKLLTQVLIPDSVIEMGRGVFDMSGLTEVVLGNGIEDVPDYAFAYCDSLVSVTINAGVKSIGNNSFRYDPLLMTVNMYPLTAPTTYNSFGNNGATLHIESGASGYNVAPWNSVNVFASIIADL